MDFGNLANGMFLGGNAFEAGRQQAKPRYYTKANWSGNGLANTGLSEIDMNKGLANPWDMYTFAYGTAEKDKDGKVTGFNFTDKFNQMNNSGMKFDLSNIFSRNRNNRGPLGLTMDESGAISQSIPGIRTIEDDFNEVPNYGAVGNVLYDTLGSNPNYKITW